MQAVEDGSGGGDARGGEDLRGGGVGEGLEGMVADGGSAKGDGEEHFAEGEDAGEGRGGVIFGGGAIRGEHSRSFVGWRE